MPSWFDRAEERIERDFEAGLISGREYQQQMRDLHAELEEYAQEEAAHARDKYPLGYMQGRGAA